jgi:uncharacterized membrane protein HdeD (DUF308 family)
MTMTMPQITSLTTNWWALALRGALAILVGLFAFMMPGATIGALVFLFGVFAMVDGVFAIMAALRGVREHDRWGWMLLAGIMGIFAGAIALAVPGLGVLALVWLVAAWAFMRGVLEIAAAIKLRKIIEGEWMLMVAGALSIILAVLIASRPGLGALVLATWIGVYAFFSGIVLLVLAFRIRKWSHEHA